jgi:hypothetical protein
MELRIAEAHAPLPVDRAFALSMTIRSFKGRRDVEAHLFRHTWDPAEEAAFDWNALLGPCIEGAADPESSRKVILEAFTRQERDQIIAYLTEHYASRLSAIDSAPLGFPVPRGLPPLCGLDEGKSIGFIRFEKIPHFHLPLALRGLYDLSQHRPIVEGI